MNSPLHRAGGSAGQRRGNLALLGLLAIAAFFLLTEHRAHLFGFLPFVLLLLCPLLHLLMHGGHGGHGRADEDGAGSHAHHRGADPGAVGKPAGGAR